jgi:hypothetical protein
MRALPDSMAAVVGDGGGGLVVGDCGGPSS